MGDSEVPAKDKLSDPSGVYMGADEVVPEVLGYAGEEETKTSKHYHEGIEAYMNHVCFSLIIKSSMGHPNFPLREGELPAQCSTGDGKRQV